MTPERLAEIRRRDTDNTPRLAAQEHRRELLAYVDELRSELGCRMATESADGAAGAYALRAETAEAERDEGRRIARGVLASAVAAVPGCRIALPPDGELPAWLTAGGV